MQPEKQNKTKRKKHARRTETRGPMTAAEIGMSNTLLIQAVIGSRRQHQAAYQCPCCYCIVHR